MAHITKHIMLPEGAASEEEYTDQERKNMHAVREFMALAYDPQRASADAVAHLVAPGATFEAPSTFPGVHDPCAYAQAHRGTSSSVCLVLVRSWRKRSLPRPR